MRFSPAAPHIGFMEPFRTITTPEELAAVRADSIVCPPTPTKSGC
jgi:hypothetical protein